MRKMCTFNVLIALCAYVVDVPHYRISYYKIKGIGGIEIELKTRLKNVVVRQGDRLFDAEKNKIKALIGCKLSCIQFDSLRFSEV